MPSDCQDRTTTSAAVYDESTPLLREQSALEAQLAVKSTQPTPLPKVQLASLCLIRVMDPIVFSQLFPYVNEFISNLHVTDDPSRIGFFSGLLESTFAIAQLCSIYRWASLSDVVGRRPVILIGTAGLAITTLLFGFSQSLWAALVLRTLSGLFSGNIAVFHSVLGELTDTTNQGLALPIYGLAWPLGYIIGSLLGGTFSNPATRIPQLFDYGFFRSFPYFLPCFLSALVTLLAATFAYYFLEETLPSKCRQMEKVTGGYPDNAIESPVPPTTLNMKSLLSIPIIRALCTSGFAVSFVCTAFDVVFVLFCYSPIQSGGLAFSPSQIGYSLAITGTASILIQLLIMPIVLRMFDAATTYSFCMLFWPFTFLMIPLLNVIARVGTDENTGLMDTKATAILWIGITLALAMTRIGSLTFAVNIVLIKENVPSLSSLGATNGLVQFSMCLARAFAPAFVSSCFALSKEHNLLGGHLWVVVMVLVSILGCSPARSIARHKK